MRTLPTDFEYQLGRKGYRCAVNERGDFTVATIARQPSSHAVGSLKKVNGRWEVQQPSALSTPEIFQIESEMND